MFMYRFVGLEAARRDEEIKKRLKRMYEDMQKQIKEKAGQTDAKTTRVIKQGILHFVVCCSPSICF